VKEPRSPASVLAKTPNGCASCELGSNKAGASGREGRKPVFVGIDVAKESLEVAVRPSGESWRIANDDAGISSERRKEPCG